MTEPALPYSAAAQPLTVDAPLGDHAGTPGGNLLTIADLSVWVRDTLDATDEFAHRIIAGASLVVRETAGHPEWTVATVPARAHLIACLLAKRSYQNPDAVVRSGVGPLSEAIVEDYARTMELTPAEKAELQEIGGQSPSGGGGGEIYFMNLGGADPVETDTRYLMDSNGVPLLYHEPGDVGAPEA